MGSNFKKSLVATALWSLLSLTASEARQTEMTNFDLETIGNDKLGGKILTSANGLQFNVTIGDPVMGYANGSAFYTRFGFQSIFGDYSPQTTTVSSALTLIATVAGRGNPASESKKAKGIIGCGTLYLVNSNDDDNDQGPYGPNSVPLVALIFFFLPLAYFATRMLAEKRRSIALKLPIGR